MTLSKGRLIAAQPAGLDLEQTLCGGLMEERRRLQSTGDGEAFHVSVQFALAHGVERAIPRSEITTLSSSTLRSGARAR